MQRIAKLADEFQFATEETRAVWRDSKGQAFLQQHLGEVRPTVGQLVSGLAETIELFEQISRRAQDPRN